MPGVKFVTVKLVAVTGAASDAEPLAPPSRDMHAVAYDTFVSRDGMPM